MSAPVRVLQQGPEILYVHWQHFSRYPDHRGACTQVEESEADGLLVCFSYDEKDDRGRHLRFIPSLCSTHGVNGVAGGTAAFNAALIEALDGGDIAALAADLVELCDCDGTFALKSLTTAFCENN